MGWDGTHKYRDPHTRDATAGAAGYAAVMKSGVGVGFGLGLAGGWWA